MTWKGPGRFLGRISMKGWTDFDVIKFFFEVKTAAIRMMRSSRDGTNGGRLGKRSSEAVTPIHVRWWLKAMVAMVAITYCLSSVTIMVHWSDMERKQHESKTSISAQIEFHAMSWWSPIWRQRLKPKRLSEDEDEESSMGEQYPLSLWRKREFSCLGWVPTDDDGEELGPRRECWERVRGGEAGFCEVLNASSGQIFHVMQTTSLSLKEDVRFTCQLAKEFTDFRHHADGYEHDPPMAVSGTGPETNGIVMAVYEGVLPTAYASIRQLRFTGCRLPIELWFRHDELARENVVLVTLIEKFGPIKLRVIHDERVDSFYVKAHAVYYSHFTNVLLLDADNFALRDPSFLFASEEFREYGAVFWPDFWYPGNTIFNLHAQSLAWELLDIDYVDMMEQESGQVLVNRHKSRTTLNKLLFYATHRPNLIAKLQLAWGDKDLFRFAWLQLRQPFYFNDHRLPGALGVINHERQRFCGLSMVQYDLEGRRILFLHRNTIKLTGKVSTASQDKRFWKFLQEFPAHDALEQNEDPEYALIQSFNGGVLFNETSCFGLRRYQDRPSVQIIDVKQTGIFGDIEERIIAFAQEAHRLMTPLAKEINT